MKVIKIEWDDSCGSERHWEGREEAEEGRAGGCESVGYLLKETEGEVSIVQSMGDKEVGNRLTIPRGCIKKIVEMRVR